MLPSVHRSSLSGCFSGHPRMDLSLDFIHADFWSAHDMKHQHASQTAFDLLQGQLIRTGSLRQTMGAAIPPVGPSGMCRRRQSWLDEGR